MQQSGLSGRGVELDELQNQLTAAAGGAGRSVLLVGSAGIGKTTLLQAATAQARAAGLRVLSATGAEAEQATPYGVIRRLFERVMDDDRVGADGAAARGRALVMDSDEGAPADEAGAATAIFWLLADVAAAGPVAMIVDDLHWADAASVRILERVRDQGAELPVALLAATRHVPDSWAAHAGTMQIAVRPLSIEAVGEILGQVLGEVPAELVRACADVCAGNPFLLREVARELRATHQGAATPPELVRSLVPESVGLSIKARLLDLGPDAQSLAQAVALLGDGADIGRAGAVAALDSQPAADAAAVLGAAGILQPDRPLRYVHPLVLAAVREVIPAQVRSRLHAAAAAYSLVGPGGLETACSHLLHVDPVGASEVVQTLRRGAARALSTGAADAAVTYLRRALAEPPRPEDLAGVTIDLAAAAYSAQESDAHDLALLAIDRAVDPVSALQAAITAGHHFTLAGSPREAVELVLRAASDPGVPPEVAEVAFGLATSWSTCSIDAREVARPLLAEARQRAIDNEGPLRLRAVGALECATGDGTAELCVELAKRAWADGELLSETGTEQPFVHFTVLSAVAAGNVPLVEQWGERLVADAAAHGSVLGRFVSVIWYAWARETRGHLAAAHAYASESVNTGSSTGGLLLLLPVPFAVLANIRLATGTPAEALEALEGLPPPGRDANLFLSPFWWHARATAHLRQGNAGQALADLENVIAWERRWPSTTSGWVPWRALQAEALLVLGDRGKARTVAVEGLDRARAFGNPRHIAACVRSLALLEPPRRQMPLLREALAITEQGACGIDRATLLIELARARLVGGHRDDAATAAAEALALADSVGANTVATSALELLLDTGAKPRRRARSGALTLSPAERRVADLAAVARSNREIAETLFLTEKTVESHLTSAYRKLGIHARAQLARALDASGPDLYGRPPPPPAEALDS